MQNIEKRHANSINRYKVSFAIAVVSIFILYPNASYADFENKSIANKITNRGFFSIQSHNNNEAKGSCYYPCGLTICCSFITKDECDKKKQSYGWEKNIECPDKEPD